MKRVLAFGADKALARFYYLIHTRTTAKHEYRNGNVACYTCTNAEYPDVLAIAENLQVNTETVEAPNRYRLFKNLLQEKFSPGQRFQCDELMELTGYNRNVIHNLINKLIRAGYVESHGRTKNQYYCRPLTANGDRQADDEKEPAP
jgi:hypothetical protein